MAVTDVVRLSGRQRAAAVLIALGPEVSAKVMRFLDPEDVEHLAFEIVNMERLPAEAREAAVRTCFEECVNRQPAALGGPGYAKDVLERSVGADRASEIIGRVNNEKQPSPFDFLHGVDPAPLAAFIQEEHPQTIALILSHLEPQLAGAVLTRFETDAQADIAARIASMGRPAPEVVEEVKRALKRRLATFVVSNSAAVGGLDCLVRILGQSTQAKAIVNTLETSAPELAEEVQKRMFVFDDIAALDDRSIQRILREIEGKDLALALKGSGEEIKSRFLKNMSARSAETLADDISALGPVRLRTVTEARQRIVAAVRRLEQAEEIIVAQAGEEDAYV
jgi:flagellar motor switch protein FliG